MNVSLKHPDNKDGKEKTIKPNGFNILFFSLLFLGPLCKLEIFRAIRYCFVAFIFFAILGFSVMELQSKGYSSQFGWIVILIALILHVREAFSYNKKYLDRLVNKGWIITSKDENSLKINEQYKDIYEKLEKEKKEKEEKLKQDKIDIQLRKEKRAKETKEAKIRKAQQIAIRKKEAEEQKIIDEKQRLIDEKERIANKKSQNKIKQEKKIRSKVDNGSSTYDILNAWGISEEIHKKEQIIQIIDDQVAYNRNKFINELSAIPGCSKQLVNYLGNKYDYNPRKLGKEREQDLIEIPGVGSKLAKAITNLKF